MPRAKMRYHKTISFPGSLGRFHARAILSLHNIIKTKKAIMPLKDKAKGPVLGMPKKFWKSNHGLLIEGTTYHIW